MLMKQIVTLEIIFDSSSTPNPTEWNWYDLDGFTSNESIEVINSTTPERIGHES